MYISTVVHIIHFKEDDGIDDAYIKQLIKDLNEIFSSNSLDTSLVHPDHVDKKMDSNIRFCLNPKSDDSTEYSGILHKDKFGHFFTDPNSPNLSLDEIKLDALGGSEYKDLDKFFNIWIGELQSESISYSFGVPRQDWLPLGELINGGLIPGVVLDLGLLYENQGPELKPANVLAHECGHALGLLHTFGIDAVGADRCDYTDHIDDTPSTKVPGRCPSSFSNSCIDENEDLADHETNIMAYGCKLMFTPGQIEQMRYNLSLAPETLFMDAYEEVFTSNSKIKRREDFTIFPNPNFGSFELRIKNDFSGPSVLSIIDLSGHIVFERKVLKENSKTINFHLPDLNAGLYFMNITNDELNLMQKFIIGER